MPTTPLRVLVVDDSVDSARMLRVLLRRDGHEVRIAHDGDEALGLVDGFGPHLALLDLTLLPDRSGLDVAREIRRRPHLAGCTLAAVSGHPGDSVPDPSPFDRFFRKPIDPDAILAYVRGLPTPPPPAG